MMTRNAFLASVTHCPVHDDRGSHLVVHNLNVFYYEASLSRSLEYYLNTCLLLTEAVVVVDLG